MKEFHEYRSVYTHDELMERLRRIRHVALDMDGTIYMGMSLFDWTQPFLAELRELGIGYSFLTNNPSKSIDDYLRKLESLGIHATREEMYTTTLATIDYLHEHHPAVSFCWAHPRWSPSSRPRGSSRRPTRPTTGPTPSSSPST